MLKSLAIILSQLDGAEQLCGPINCVGVDCAECPFNNGATLAETIDKLQEASDE